MGGQGQKRVKYMFFSFWIFLVISEKRECLDFMFTLYNENRILYYTLALKLCTFIPSTKRIYTKVTLSIFSTLGYFQRHFQRDIYNEEYTSSYKITASVHYQPTFFHFHCHLNFSLHHNVHFSDQFTLGYHLPSLQEIIRN